MIRSLAGLALRQTFAALSFGATFLFFTFMVVESEFPDKLAAMFSVLRLSTLVAVTVMLLVEAPRLTEQLRLRTKWIKDAGLPMPRRPDLWVRGGLPTIGLALAVFGAFTARWVWTGGECASVLEFFFVFLATRTILGLIAGSWTRVRLWWTARSSSANKRMLAAYPLLAAAEATLGVAIVFVRMPHIVLGKIGLVLLVVATDVLLETLGSGDVELLVQLGPDDHIGEILPTIRDYGARAVRAAPSAHVATSSIASRTFVVTVPTVIAPMLVVELDADDENVDQVELNAVIEPTLTPGEGRCPTGSSSLTNDPLSSDQVALTGTGGDFVVAALSRGGSPPVLPVLLGVIDEGIDTSHEDLQGVVRRALPDFRGNHGTAIAGIAAAVGSNGRGIASLNHRGGRIHVRDYSALAVPDPHAADVAEALHIATDDGARVVVMAFGAVGNAPTVLKEAVRYARRHDVLLVTAAGNRGPYRNASEGWPANIPGVLVATGLHGSRPASFSNRADVELVVAAPAAGVCAPVPGDLYERQSGTSMAAAIVAGAAAFRRGQCPRSSAEQVIRTIRNTATPDPMGSVGPHLRIDRLAMEPCP